MRRFLLRGLTLSALLVLLLGMLPPALVQAKVDQATITVYITSTGHKYHRSGCRFLRKSKIKTTLKAAKEAGYTPCSVCDPPE